MQTPRAPPPPPPTSRHHEQTPLLTSSRKENMDPSLLASFAKRLMRRQSTFWPDDRELLFRHPSLELIVPAHDCASRKSSPAIAIANLVATVCGGGVLTLPQAFLRAGILPASFLMILAAVITDFSMYILVSCARRSGGRSYGDVARNAFGPMAEIVATGLLLVLLFFVVTAYMVLLQQLWAPILLQALPMLLAFLRIHRTNEIAAADAHADEVSQYILMVLVVLLLPLLLQTDLHALRHTCYVGMASAVVLMLGVTQQALLRNVYQRPELFVQNVMWIGDWNGILYAFPIIVLSFFSIYNVLSVHGALFNPTRSRVKSVIDWTIGICFALFYVVGLAGYLYAYDTTADNILLNFDLDITVILVGRVGYGITIMFGMPLVFLPCRAAVLSLPEQIRDRNQVVQQGDAAALHAAMKGAKHHVANSCTFDEESPLSIESKSMATQIDVAASTADLRSSTSSVPPPLAEPDATVCVKPLPPIDPSLHHEAERDPRVHLLSTAVLLSLSYFMAVGVPGVGVVWSIAGSSMALVIGFVIPAACYLKIRSKKNINPRSVGASVLLVFAVVASVVCTTRTLQAL